MARNKPIFSERLLRWRCGSCGTWNDGEVKNCPKCGGHIVGLSATQVLGELTHEEKMFYNTAVPGFMRVMKGIHTLLERIDHKLEELNDGKSTKL